ncbi:thiamine diphosphokinase [Candidatus Obscuribacterales bacterium]|nr:thiamine diphosphokinase [Candidatus Obscuribacterales bacterium]
MPRVFIIANGQADFPFSFPSLISSNDIVICADGGSNHAAELGVKPAIVIGDMDSVAPELLLQYQQGGVDIRRFPKDKDASDLELCLEAAVGFNPTEITCICVLGNREDHSLTNTFLLARYASRNNKVTMLGSNWQAQFITKQHPREFTGTPGDIVSLMPMTATVAGVTIEGVKWPLENAELAWGSSHTVSNEFAQTHVSIKITTGLILAIHYYIPSY